MTENTSQLQFVSFDAIYEGDSSFEFAEAYEAFIGLGISLSAANDLASGHNSLHLISANIFDPLRLEAVELAENFKARGYWNEEE